MVDPSELGADEEHKSVFEKTNKFNQTKFNTVSGLGMQGGAFEFESDVQFQSIDNPLQPTSQFLLKRSQQMVRNKHETSLALRNSNTLKKGGYEVSRLLKPDIAQLNDDFLCGICQSKQPSSDQHFRHRQHPCGVRQHRMWLAILHMVPYQPVLDQQLQRVRSVQQPFVRVPAAVAAGVQAALQLCDLVRHLQQGLPDKGANQARGHLPAVSLLQ